MDKIVKTKKIQTDSNKATQEAHIYITRQGDARDPVCNWEDGIYDEIFWSKYQIKETNPRTKTATFTSNTYLDLTTGSYRVMITSPFHEDFGGVVLKVEYDASNQLYNYTCQDGTRFYLDEEDVITTGDVTIHDVLRDLLTFGILPMTKKPNKIQLNFWKPELAGLHPLKDYDKLCGNMMRLKPQMIIKGKKRIDIIRALCSGEGSNVDVFFDKYGVLHIDPYDGNDFINTGLHLQPQELSDARFTFDTTNAITRVVVTNKDAESHNVYFNVEELVNLDLSLFFGRSLTTSISNPYEAELAKTTTAGDKSSSDSINTDNPYGTKRKAFEISTDNITKSASADLGFANKVASLLQKNGWKKDRKTIRDSNGHSEKHFNIKDGIHIIIVRGTDAGVIREQTMESSYVKRQRKLHSRTVWILRWKPGLLDIIGNEDDRKWIPRAHDDNYSPRNFKGLKNPVDRLIKYKIPWITIKDDKPETAVAKFLKGGDIPEAL